MQEINWGAFKAKFNGREQSSFEWLCYLLFCKEFNKNIGIFRYKNQSAIETNPIIETSEVIGWQAKYYETKLSDHKSDLIKMIEKTKRDYPNVTKIIFCTVYGFIGSKRSALILFQFLLNFLPSG